MPPQDLFDFSAFGKSFPFFVLMASITARCETSDVVDEQKAGVHALPMSSAVGALNA
jgi:hypothetical protein